MIKWLETLGFDAKGRRLNARFDQLAIANCFVNIFLGKDNLCALPIYGGQ